MEKAFILLCLANKFKNIKPNTSPAKTSIEMK